MMSLMDRSGKILAKFWLSLIGITILLSFPICGIVSALAVGAGAAAIVGYGTLGAIVFFVVAFGFGLFLSVFVWPHAKPALVECAEVLSK